MMFKNLTKVVEDILLEVPEAKNSDSLLYYRICEKQNNVVLGMPFGIIISSLEDYGLPPFESVSRVRRKLQRENPELRACEKVQEFRKEQEKAYREYARC